MDEKRKAQTPPDGGKRSRAAPTIDLTATEIQPEFQPESTKPGPEQQNEQPQAQASGAETPPPEAPAAPASGAGEVPPDAEPPVTRGRSGVVLPFVAGIAGGIIPAAIAAALWYAGVEPARSTAELQPRLAAVEQRVSALGNDIQSLQAAAKALQARTDNLQNAPALSVDPKAIDALGQRVANLEAAVRNMPSGSQPDQELMSRVGAAENAAKSNAAALGKLSDQVQQAAASASQASHQADAIGTAVNQLASRVDELARQQPAGVTPAQFEALRKQVAALQQATQSARKDIAENAAAASASRLALAAASLRNAVLSHAPYQTELAQAQALGADPKQLAPLRRFASSGLPSDAQLADALRKLIPALTQAATSQASGTFLDRLRANAERLVRVTPANAPAGDDAADVLTRLTLEADRADIEGAVRDIQKLPPEAQQKAAEWVATVKARNEALGAARAFAADTARALGR